MHLKLKHAGLDVLFRMVVCDLLSICVWLNIRKIQYLLVQEVKKNISIVCISFIQIFTILTKMQQKLLTKNDQCKSM